MSQNKGGRPAIQRNEKTAAQVFECAKNGTVQMEIAHIAGMAENTLVKLYAAELKQGRAHANNEVAKTLYELATSGNVQAAIFWAKTRMGWRETQRLDLTSEDGTMTPQKSTVNIDFSKYTADELSALCDKIFANGAG